MKRKNKSFGSGMEKLKKEDFRDEIKMSECNDFGGGQGKERS